MGWKRRSPSTLETKKEEKEEEPEILRMERKASLLDVPVIRMLRTDDPSAQSESEDTSQVFGLEPEPAEVAGKAAEPSPPSLEREAASEPKATVPKGETKAAPKATVEPKTEQPAPAEKPKGEGETKAEPKAAVEPKNEQAEEPKGETTAERKAAVEPKKEQRPQPAPAESPPSDEESVSETGEAPISAQSSDSAESGAAKKPPEEGASWIDIVIPGAQTVLHVKNPEEIEATSSDPNPQVATFRTNNVTVEAVPLVPNERLSVSQTPKGNRTLLVEALEALQAGGGGADARPFPNVATAAVAAMDRALSEAALTSRDIDKVEVHSRAALEKSESLDEKASELSKTLEDIADGVSEASPQQVAKGAEEALRLRGLWQEDQNSSLMAEREKRELLSQLAEQLSTVVRSGVTALKAVTLGLHLEVNLTAAAANFRALSDESSGSLLPVEGVAGTEEIQRYKEVLLQKLKDIRILPPVGRPLTAEIASGKDGPMTIELVAKNETASDFKALKEDLELASRQLRNATSHVQEMAKELEAADAANRSVDVVSAKKQNLTRELLSIVEATEKLSKGISDFPEEGEAGISVATSVANRSAALEEGASKARTVAALLRSAELDFEESLNRSTEATARLAGAGHDAQSQLLQALQAAGSGLRLANASGAKVDLSGLQELFGKGTLGALAPEKDGVFRGPEVAGQDLVPIFRVNATTSQIPNLPYDRFFAPAQTTSTSSTTSTTTKAEEPEEAEAAEAAEVPVPSTSSRERQSEEEENWMPKAVLFSMACVLSLLVAVLSWPTASAL